MILRELVTKLGFDADDAKVKRFDGAVKNLNIGLAALVAGATAAAAGAAKLAKDTAAYGDEVAKTSRVLGMSAEELQAQRFAFDRAGVSATEYTTALEYMARQTEYSADQLPALLDELAAMDDANQRAARSQELFGRSGIRMGSALRGGSAELEALKREFEDLGGAISDADAIASEEFTDTMTNMQTQMQGLGRQIGVGLFPVMTEIIKELQEFIRTNREMLLLKFRQFFETAIRITRQTIQVFRSVWRTVDTLIKSFGGWERAIVAVGAVMLAAFAWTKPLLAIAALVGLLIDDFLAWRDGSASVLGAIFGDFEKFRDRFMDLFGGLIEALGHIWDAITAAFMGDWDDALKSLGAAFVSLFNWIGDFVSRVFSKIWDGVVSGFSWIGDFVSQIFSKIWDGIVSGFTAAINKVSSFLPDWMMGGPQIANQEMDAGGFLNSTPMSEIPSPQIANQAMDTGGGANVSVQDSRSVSVTVPPGTTEEQAQYIRREVEQSMGREYDAAALALEY